MNIKRSKLIAIFTGFLSILICLFYLIFIAVFDSRVQLDNYLTNLSQDMGAISYFLRNFYF